MSQIVFRSLTLAVIVLGGCNTADKVERVAEPSINAATFIGSGACQTCHADAFADWVGSHHERAMQIATADTVLGDFNNSSLDYFGSTTRFFTRDDGYFVLTRDALGQDREFRIAYTFGVEPLQQYLIEFPGGRLQTLAFSWDARPTAEGGQRWFHTYGDEYIAPDDELHWTGPQQNWNYMCAECHSTNVDMGFDAESDAFTTTYSEISVGCESCHGPGSAHVELASSGNDKVDYGLEVDLDDRGDTTWIMNPGTGIAERSELRMVPQQQPEACGRCHSRRGIIAPDYEYGEPLAHTHMPALLDEALYFDDGQILDEVYVYGSFLQSRMYQAGVSCTDCHNPHSVKLVAGDDPSAVCAQCHLSTKFAAPEHARHTREQAGCVDCHMASRTYMGVDDRRDHSFRIPRPDLTASIGTPNACSNCHGDRDANWATAAISTWRGDDAWQRPHFATALHAGRHGFANDLLLEVITGNDYPGIARATAVSLLAQPLGRQEFRTLEAQLGNADVLIRIAALRQLRNFPPELRLRLPGSRLLADPVRGVRIEAVSTYAGMQDLLPLEDARAYSRAERDYRESYEAIANRPEALLALAAFESAEGRVPEALELYQTALRMEPRAASARVNLADMLRGLGREAEAEAVLREGLELDATNAALHYALGLSLVRSSRTDAALEELRRAADLEPGIPRYAYVLSVALNSLGQPQQALKVMGDAHAQFDGNFDIAMGLATMRRDSGDRDGALEIAYALARRHPEEQSVLALLRSLDATL
jgi:tetratricopeptide (TPR) repeat protein